MNKRLTVALSACALAAGALLPAGCSAVGSQQALPVPESPVFTSIAGPEPDSDALEPRQEPGPVSPPVDAGALVGNQQRSWPGGVDDSVHAEPGTVNPDVFLGRPAHTPIGHDGDFPGDAGLKDGSCDAFKGLEGQTQQQYVNARYMVVNDQAGPTKAVRAVPRGYAHSPAGALVAAMNTATFHPNSGDEVAAESYEQLAKSSALAKQLREEGGHENPEQYATSRFLTMPAPVAYNILQCEKDFVQVELAIFFEPDQLEREEELLVGRIGMRWVDGDWVGDFSGKADEEVFQHGRHDLDGFTYIDYV